MIKRRKKTTSKNTSKNAAVQDADTIAKLSAVITSAQKRHDIMAARLEIAEALLGDREMELERLRAQLDRETFPPMGCQECNGRGFIDEVSFYTGEVFRARCPHC